MMDRFLAELSPAADAPPAVLYHGTTSDFDAFDDALLASDSEHSASRLGHYLTASPAIAETFALEACLVDRAYDTIAGSKVLLDVSWALRHADASMEGRAHRMGGRVACFSVTPRRAGSVPAQVFADLVDEFALDDGEWLEVRRRVIALGYDSILVEGDPEAVDNGTLCVEYAADMWVVLDPSIASPAAVSGVRENPIESARRRMAVAPGP